MPEALRSSRPDTDFSGVEKDESRMEPRKPISTPPTLVSGGVEPFVRSRERKRKERRVKKAERQGG